MSQRQAGGVSAVWTCLTVDDVEQELKFLESAFQGKVLERRKRNNDGVENATARVGGSILMLETKRAAAPQSKPELYVWVDNLEASFAGALHGGATSREKPRVLADGTRSAVIVDPNGVTWRLGQERAQPSTKEVERRLLEQRKARL